MTTIMDNESHFLDKKKEADTIIKRYTLIAAGTGFIPIPLLDAVAMSGVQYTMVRKLASLYEIPFKKHRVKAIGAAFMGSIGTISGFKFIPKIGTVIGGVSSSTIGAASTYAIGQVFMQHFDQGGTLLDFDPLTSRTHFERELEKGKEIIAKLREEGALKTEKGQQQAIQALLADNDQYIATLAELQDTINQLLAPSSDSQVPQVSISEEQVASIKEDIDLAENKVTLINPTIPSIEKRNWWNRLKQWWKKKRRN